MWGYIYISGLDPESDFAVCVKSFFANTQQIGVWNTQQIGVWSFWESFP